MLIEIEFRFLTFKWVCNFKIEFRCFTPPRTPTQHSLSSIFCNFEFEIISVWLYLMILRANPVKNYWFTLCDAKFWQKMYERAVVVSVWSNQNLQYITFQNFVSLVSVNNVLNSQNVYYEKTILQNELNDF